MKSKPNHFVSPITKITNFVPSLPKLIENIVSKPWKIIGLILVFSWLAACSSENYSSHQLKKNVTILLNQAQIPTTTGIVIQSMDTGKILYSKNPDLPFMPASNLKLYTAVAALQYLGANFTFQTELLSDATLDQNGNLNGNLYLKFAGDPNLKIRYLNRLFQDLYQAGVHSINGNLYLDNTKFNGDNLAPGWMWDDLNYCYAAPISTIMINQNCFSILLNPNKKPGELAELKFLSDFNQLTPIVNNIFTIPKNAKGSSLSIKANFNNQYQLLGYIPSNAKSTDLDLSIKNPDLHATQILPILLAKNHILLTGKILLGKTPSQSKILAIHNSKPLRLLVNTMLKQSDNIIANSLLKTLGATYYQQPGNWQNGVNALKAILTKAADINFAKSTIVDGSGMSRYDLVTPEQTAQLLNFAYHNFTISPEFISALPIAGEDGTLDLRMLNKQQGKVRAKTGTMTGVSALSGYLETSQHHVIAFVIFFNNYVEKNTAIENLEDKICGILSNV